MGEMRPVPRRERALGECRKESIDNPRLTVAMIELKMLSNLLRGEPIEVCSRTFKLFWQCMRSKPGEEPTDPYSYLQLDPPKRDVNLE